MQQLKAWEAKLQNWLFHPVPGSHVSVFRFLWGAVFVWEAWRYWHYGKIQRYFIDRTFHFHYYYFDWVNPFPPFWMYVLFGVMALAGAMFALGIFYRVSAVVLFLTYTWQFLCDKTDYNNHYYLMSIVCGVWILIDANKSLSLDAKYGLTKPSLTVPRWNHWILKLQICVVYFYGGIAKLNWDWLGGEPMRHWLYERSDYPLIGEFYKTEYAAYFYSYGGLLFDLAVPFMLWYRKTRLLAIPAVIFFHGSNHFMYSIGVFPVLMICTTVLFFDHETIVKVLGKLRIRFGEVTQKCLEVAPNISVYRRAVGYFVMVYVVLQLLLPFRHHLYENYVSWSEEAHNFSWHMKLRDKQSYLRMQIIDPSTGLAWDRNLHDDLSSRQIRKMSSRPHMIHEYVQFVKRDLQERLNIRNPVIKLDAVSSLNFRPFRRLVDPNANLAMATYHPFANNDWITPFDPNLKPMGVKENLRATLEKALEQKNFR